MIAADRRDRPLDEDIGGAGRVEWAAEMIAEIDDIVDPERVDVGEHRFESEIVTMDISNDGKSHRRPLDRAQPRDQRSFAGFSIHLIISMAGNIQSSPVKKK